MQAARFPFGVRLIFDETPSAAPTYRGDRFPGHVESGSLIPATNDLRQNIGPRLTAHQNDQHGKPEVANLPESGIRPLVSCARAKRGRDRARRFGEAGRASINFFSHLISDACMDAKYGRTREIFDRFPPYAHGTVAGVPHPNDGATHHSATGHHSMLLETTTSSRTSGWVANSHSVGAELDHVPRLVEAGSKLVWEGDTAASSKLAPRIPRCQAAPAGPPMAAAAGLPARSVIEGLCADHCELLRDNLQISQRNLRLASVFAQRKLAVSTIEQVHRPARRLRRGGARRHCGRRSAAARRAGLTHTPCHNTMS